GEGGRDVGCHRLCCRAAEGEEPRGEGVPRPVVWIRDGRGRGSGAERSVQVGIGVCFARCASIYRQESYLNGRVTTSSRISRRPRRAHKNRRLQSPDG
ncbi:unnamed protein product, partial [Musa hybrid cultivar]